MTSFSFISSFDSFKEAPDKIKNKEKAKIENLIDFNLPPLNK